MKVKLGEEKLIFCAPNNEQTAQWGVYSLPKLWRLPNGKLAIYINGMIDSPDAFENVCPDIFYVSNDNGESWEISSSKEVNKNVFNGVDSPYYKLPDGQIITIREKDNRNSVNSLKWHKEFLTADKQGKCRTYLQENVPDNCFSCELFTYDPNGKLISIKPVNIDFPKRELITQSHVKHENVYKEIPAYFRSNLVCCPYISSLTNLSDGTLVGVCSGQNPNVFDRCCAEVYLMESNDGGKSWKKRSTITSNSIDYPFGLVGDGAECSLAVAENGYLYLLTRTDMSCDHTIVGGSSDAFLFVSKDNGYTWTKERSVSDSSVTPHVITLNNNIVVIIYGRPGVHMKISYDGGKSFGSSISIIGKTLEEELSDGKSYMSAKYFDMRSYSNSFIEKLSEDSFLIVYSDMKYDNGDGAKRKATFVRKVIFTKD